MRPPITAFKRKPVARESLSNIQPRNALRAAFVVKIASPPPRTIPTTPAPIENPPDL